jgi:hypothetical protein
MRMVLASRDTRFPGASRIGCNMPTVSRRLTRFVGVTATAALASLIGCGGGGTTELGLSVGVGAAFQFQDGPPRSAGYQLVVLIEQVETATRPTCPKLPSDLRLLVDGAEVTPVFDSATGCLSTPVTLGPYPKIGPVAVEARNGDQVLGQAQFDGLTPGGDATLASPPDGMVHAGDDIVVVPPPALSTAWTGRAFVYPLDDTSVSSKLTPLAERRADGVHVILPVFSGRAAVTFTGMPYVVLPSYSCPGFDVCTADADTTLGPVFVTEVP